MKDDGDNLKKAGKDSCGTMTTGRVFLEKMIIMKRYYLAVMVIMIMLLMCGCDSDSSYNQALDELIEDGKTGLVEIIDEEKAEEFSKLAAEYSYDENAADNEVTIIDLTAEGMSDPAGIAICDEGLLISDAGNNCLYLTDRNGVVERTIGEVGNAEGEYLYPTGLAQWEDMLFVIDSGNERIVILDSEYNFKNQIQLPDVKFNPDDRFTDIAIDHEGNIYVCGTFTKNSGIYYKEPGSNEFKRTAKGFYGCLFEKDGSVYALSYGNIFIDREGHSFGVRGGDNRLWEIKVDEANEICALPVCLAPESFVIANEEEVTVMSSYEMGILTYDIKDGSYLKTEYKYDMGSNAPYESYMAADGESIYMIDRDNKYLIIINED